MFVFWLGLGFFLIFSLSNLASPFAVEPSVGPHVICSKNSQINVEESDSISSSSIDAHQTNLEEELEVPDQFPNFTQIPLGVRFSCRNREPGFYANPQANCQVYHHCLPDGRSYAFLCGVGTIFNQRAFTCDHWYNYNCADAEQDYIYNTNFYPSEFQEINNV